MELSVIQNVGNLLPLKVPAQVCSHNEWVSKAAMTRRARPPRAKVTLCFVFMDTSFYFKANKPSLK
ncbi:UNVERIFIED_CONTAM: hypothetical protein FKN15_019182 [Acipenser sinensis]